MPSGRIYRVQAPLLGSAPPSFLVPLLHPLSPPPSSASRSLSPVLSLSLPPSSSPAPLLLPPATPPPPPSAGLLRGRRGGGAQARSRVPLGRSRWPARSGPVPGPSRSVPPRSVETGARTRSHGTVAAGWRRPPCPRLTVNPAGSRLCV